MRIINIGRSPENQVVIDDMTISRNHAKIEVDDTNKIFITDISSNGTFVNGQRIFLNLRKQILRGDKVNFAKVVDLDWSLIPPSVYNGTIINSPMPPIFKGVYREPVKPMQQQNTDSLDFLKLAVSLIMPLYGIILYFMYQNSAPKKSSQAITAALIGVGIWVIITISKN